MTGKSKSRKSGRKAATQPEVRAAKAQTTSVTKLDQLTALLARDGGASIAEMTAATGWQPHSVRGALAGSLKRRGLTITSEKIDGIRHYRTEASQ